MTKYFDIHSHLNFPDYDNDREEVVERMRNEETHAIVVGTDLESSKRAVELASLYEEVYACIGVHPVDDPSRTWDEEEFAKLISKPRVVAVGETGLDFFRNGRDSIDKQRMLFEKHIEFALRHEKPLMLHIRDAYSEALDILESAASEHGEKLRGNAHFFAGGVEAAKRFLDIGFTLSFTGVITFTHDYDEVVRFAPLDMIMSETDAPYVAPTPYRGKRNEPSYVSEVVKKIAEIRNEDFEVVRKALVANACRTFNLVLK